MFVKILILSIIFLTIAAVGFGITILLKPRGQFPQTHVSQNPEMAKRGITCAQETDTGCNSSGCSACTGRMF